MKKTLILFLFTIALVGCQSPKKSQQAQHSSDLTALMGNELDNNGYALITQDPWSFIQSQLQIDVPNNKRIVAERDLILKNPNSFEKNVLRSEPYIFYIIDQLNQRNMPVEFAFIPLIESAYNPRATSYAKAAGLWQIMPITAREFGLKKSNWYDPRRDLIESTNTALNLLQYLNQRFDGDWLLTLAAYNAGEGRVKRAISWNKSKGLPTNYWALNLSKETMRYIPKLLATIDIIKNEQQYNVNLPDVTYTNSLVRVDLTERVKLEKIAKYADISLDELLAFNAGYLKKEVKGPYHVLVPSSCAKDLHEKLQESNLVNSDVIDLLLNKSSYGISNMTVSNSGLTNSKYGLITDKDIRYYEQEHKRYSQIIYRVKSGDNLYSIAKKHKVKVSEIVKWNKIQNANRLKPGDKLTINIKNGSS